MALKNISMNGEVSRLLIPPRFILCSAGYPVALTFFRCTLGGTPNCALKHLLK